MNTTCATPELFAAMALAQGEIENASKNAANPHFRSRYADLAEVLNTVRPVFSKNGLAMVQSTEFDGSLVAVVTVIAHKGGGHISSSASCVPSKSDAQGIGAATTYLRRYGAAAMAGISQEDDDGEAAAHNTPPARPAPAPAPASKRITEAQHKLLEASIGDLGLDRERVKGWVMKAFGAAHFSDLTGEQLDILLRKLTQWANKEEAQ
jgi:hypothetical protein